MRVLHVTTNQHTHYEFIFILMFCSRYHICDKQEGVISYHIQRIDKDTQYQNQLVLFEISNAKDILILRSISLPF